MHSFAALPGTIERLLTGVDRGLDDALGRVRRALRPGAPRLPRRIRLEVRRAARRASAARARARRRIAAEVPQPVPSTTTAHATTLQSGLPVGVHGLYEWFILEPSLDRLIAPLLFSYAGDDEAHTLVAEGLSPDAVFPAETLHMRLEAAGVRCVGAVPGTRAHGAERGVDARRGDPRLRRSAAGFAGVAAALAESERVYASIYLPSFDALMHVLGPDSPDAESELVTLLGKIEDGFARARGNTPPRRVGSRHVAGLARRGRPTLNVAWRGLERHLRRGARRQAARTRRVVPRSLPARPSRPRRRGRRRAVRPTGRGSRRPALRRSSVEDGTFGDELSDAFLARLAEVVVLPHPGEAAYWLEPQPLRAALPAASTAASRRTRWRSRCSALVA